MSLDNQNVNPPVEVTRDTVASDNYVLNQIKRQLFDSSDQFGRQIRLNTRNVADIAAHYPYSPERFRIFVDNVRQFIEYDGEPAQFRDETDHYVMAPQAEGEVVEFDTTEVFRYVVGYVLEWSIAVQMNQSLQSGDIVAIGYGDPDLENATGGNMGPSADGWFLIWEPELEANEVKLAQYRNGTEQDSEIATRAQDLTEWTRFAGETNWYGVGATDYIETYTEDGRQFNDPLGSTSADGIRGPTQGNFPLSTSVKVGAASAGSLEVEIGSFGLRIFGDTNPQVRRKTQDFDATINTTGTFVPIYAFHVDPDRRLVTTQLTDIRVPEFSGNGDVVIVAFAFNETKLRDSGGNPIVDGDFSTPNIHSAQNSVIEETFAVDQFPDSTGTIVTDTTNPGGYQEGFGANYQTGGATKGEPISQQEKRLISERDIIVFLANASVTGDVTVEYVTEQQW